MGISENRNCKFCTDEIDNIEHLFWSCGKKKKKVQKVNTTTTTTTTTIKKKKK